MKILHVITSLQMGGAETLVVNLMPRFCDMGHEVGVVVFNGEETPLMKRLERECPECEIYCFGSSYYNPLCIFKLIRVMQEFDVVHTHNSSPQLFAAIATLCCRRKLVTTEHSTNNRKRERGGLFRIVDKWMYGRYDSVICISKIAEEKLRAYLNCNEERIVTINNGVDVKMIHSARPIDNLRTKKFVIVMVAGFREAKDQDTVIRAMALLPRNQFELWLVGDGVRRSNLELTIDNLKLKDCVRLLGLRTDVPSVLKTADAVVMSSHWEGLSLSNIEGMSAGKPFVASDVNGLREVTKGYGLLFPHENDKALAEIILRLYQDEEFYNEIASRCYERAKEYDIEKTVKGYLHVYEDLLS